MSSIATVKNIGTEKAEVLTTGGKTWLLPGHSATVLKVDLPDIVSDSVVRTDPVQNVTVRNTGRQIERLATGQVLHPGQICGVPEDRIGEVLSGTIHLA